MSPLRSYRPPIATRGSRLATRGRKLPRSSLGFRGALLGASRVLIATRYPALPPPRSYPSYRFRDMLATVSSPTLALMPPHIMQAAYMRPLAPARLLSTATAALLRAARGGDAMQQYKSVSRSLRTV
eukprot:scaffold11979_cov108-Isochrysis_galbana.AAC.7